MSIPEETGDHEGLPAGDGRAMVLLHGAGGNHLVWAEVRKLLAVAGVPAIGLDLPGHGRSPLPLTADVRTHAEGVAARLQALGVRRTVIVGHSLGGAVALRLAASTRIRVDGLGVVSSGGRLPVSESLLAGLLGNFPATVARIVRAAFARATDPGCTAKFEAMLLEAGAERMRADFEACAGYGLSRGELASIAVPVSVLCGDQDVLTPLALAEELAAALRTVSLVRLPGVGHMPMIEAAEQTAITLQELWARACANHVAPAERVV